MSITLENVFYTYSPGTVFEKHALKDVSFTISEGQFVGIIGHTGSGKSTLLHQLNGLMQPTSGKVLFKGEDIWGEKYDRRKLRFLVGVVFQYPDHQLFETTVLKDVEFGPKNKGLTEAEARAQAEEALHLVGLPEELFEKSPFDLSGGQKRKAAVAGILAMKPEVLVLDEPTAGLDPKSRDELLELIAGLKKTLGITVILVSHSMEDVARYAERLLVLDQGELLYDGTPKEVFRHYKELEAIGLSAPQVTYLMHELAARGLDVDTDAITVQEALGSINNALQKNEKSPAS